MRVELTGKWLQWCNMLDISNGVCRVSPQKQNMASASIAISGFSTPELQQICEKDVLIVTNIYLRWARVRKHNDSHGGVKTVSCLESDVVPLAG